MKKLLYLMTIVGLICCKSFNKEDYEYIPLNNITNDTSLINSGEEVKLLAFSGGKDNDKNNIYYQQIIVTTENSADTLIIVCPLLKMPYPDENTGRFYITPLEYNPEKKDFKCYL